MEGMGARGAITARESTASVIFGSTPSHSQSIGRPSFTLHRYIIVPMRI